VFAGTGTTVNALPLDELKVPGGSEIAISIELLETSGMVIESERMLGEVLSLDQVGSATMADNVPLSVCDEEVAGETLIKNPDVTGLATGTGITAEADKVFMPGFTPERIP